MYKLNVNEYEKIGAPAQVIDWIRNGATLPFRTPPPDCFYENRIYSTAHIGFVDGELHHLVKNGAIKKVPYKPRCVLALRAVPRKVGN